MSSNFGRRLHHASLCCTLLLSAITLSMPASGQFLSQRTLDTESLKARIADLNPPEKGLPEDALNLADERRGVEEEIATVRAAALRDVDLSQGLSQLDTARQKIAETIESIRRINCRSDEDVSTPIKKLRATLINVSRIVSFNDLEDVPNPFDDSPLAFEREDKRTEREKCEAWQRFASDPQKRAAFVAFPDALRQRILDEQKSLLDNKAQASTLLDLLQKRRTAIQKKLTESQNQSTLSSNLWVMIGTIGLLSVSAILAVKLFDERIQIEWVASGQVIQFVTVMILLSVVMALGLAGILKENTLGTLLGGIAGYVLAQGVGRAVARDVTRNAERAQG